MDRESTGSIPFRSSTPLPHHLPQGLPHCRWTPNCGWVLLGVGTPPLSQLPLRGAGPTFAPPSLPPTPSGPAQLEGASGGQRIRPRISAGSWGPKWAGETWPRSHLILCPPNGSPNSPFRRGIPSPPPATPQQGRQSHPASTSPPPSLPPPCPPSYPVTGGSSRPLRCPWSHWRLVGVLVVRRREFSILLVCHLDSAPPLIY